MVKEEKEINIKVNEKVIIGKKGNERMRMI